jgi:hypothetical protein
MRLDFGARFASNLVQVISLKSLPACWVSGACPDRKNDMKFCIAAAIALATATLLTQGLTQASAGGDQGLPCTARVLYSEELPFAPINTWLVKVTLEVTPPNGSAFVTSMQKTIPWQVRPPRQGQTFRVRCDPANPGDLQLMSKAAARTAF